MGSHRLAFKYNGKHIVAVPCSNNLACSHCSYQTNQGGVDASAMHVTLHIGCQATPPFFSTFWHVGLCTWNVQKVTAEQPKDTLPLSPSRSCIAITSFSPGTVLHRSCCWNHCTTCWRWQTVQLSCNICTQKIAAAHLACLSRWRGMSGCFSCNLACTPTKCKPTMLTAFWALQTVSHWDGLASA